MDQYYLTDEQLEQAEKNGIRKDLAIRRVNDGWSFKRAITQKPRRSDLAEWVEIAEQNGIGKFTFYNRVLNLDWDEETAATKKIQVHKKTVK